jgi:hypothetical protein
LYLNWRWNETEPARPVFHQDFFRSGLEKEEFMRIMRDEVNVDRDVEVKMISLADRLRQEGIEKGIKKGAFLNAVETCKNALRSGLSPEIVSQITKLPLEKVLEIQSTLNNSN